MKSKHKFTPDQVVPMEERALLSSFPALLHPVTTLHHSGNFVLTSTAYFKLQSAINTDIHNFELGVIRLLNKQGGYTAAFSSAVGTGTLGKGPFPNSYASGTLLAILDKEMGSLDFKVPGGGGRVPSIGGGGGLGLSNKTFLTTQNPVSLKLGGSVAELMDETITADAAANATSATLTSNMNTVRAEALTIVPGYIDAFGPPGAREFGTKNS